MKIGFVTNLASKSFSNPINLEYAMNKITIERKDKIRTSHNPIKSNRIFGEFRTNTISTMNPIIKLQENGTVTVTDTETTTTLSKATVDEICRLVRDKDNPKLRKVNVWYGLKQFPKYMCFTPDNFHYYGINDAGEWFEEKSNNLYKFLDSDNYELAPETVEQYLKEEAVKRGFLKDGVSFKSLKSDGVWTKSGNLELKYDSQTNALELWSDISGTRKDYYTDNYRSKVDIFYNGKFATIINPETITKAEAEKELGKVITD